MSKDARMPIGTCAYPSTQKITFWATKEDLCLPTKYAVDKNEGIHTCLGLCMAALPDERSVVVGTLGEHLLLWNLTDHDLPEGKLIGRFSALHLTLSPDKRTLVVSTHDGNIFFLRIGTWECQRAIALEDGHNAYCLAFSPDGNRFASGYGVREKWLVTLWDTKSLERLREWQVPASVRNLLFSPDGQFVVTLDTDAFIRIWSDGRMLAEHKTTEQPLSQPHNAMAFLPNQGTLIFAKENSLWSWRFLTGEMKKEVALPGLVSSMALSPGKEVLAVGCHNGKIYMLRAENFESLYEVEGHYESVDCSHPPEAIDFSPGGQLMVSGPWGCIHLWKRVDKEELIAMRTGLDKKPSGITFGFSDYRLMLVSQPDRESAYLMKATKWGDHHVVTFRKRWMQEDFDYPVWV